MKQMYKQFNVCVIAMCCLMVSVDAFSQTRFIKGAPLVGSVVDDEHINVWPVVYKASDYT